MATVVKESDTITVMPLHPAIGAEISGVDLSRPLDPVTVEAIRDAWHDMQSCCSAIRKISPARTSFASPAISERLLNVISRNPVPARLLMARTGSI